MVQWSRCSSRPPLGLNRESSVPLGWDRRRPPSRFGLFFVSVELSHRYMWVVSLPLGSVFSPPKLPLPSGLSLSLSLSLSGCNALYWEVRLSSLVELPSFPPPTPPSPCTLFGFAPVPTLKKPFVKANWHLIGLGVWVIWAGKKRGFCFKEKTQLGDENIIARKDLWGCLTSARNFNVS